MTFKEFEKASKQQLREEAKTCFERANDQNQTELRLIALTEAQFYMQELDRRHDGWIATRDLILEIVVIVLIGGEILFGDRAARDQGELMKSQTAVLQKLKESASATADTLTALKSTTEVMNVAMQRQLALFYDVALVVTIDNGTKRMTFSNTGRTNIVLFGLKLGDGEAIFEKEGRTVSPTAAYQIDASESYASIAKRFAKGAGGLIPFDVYVKNEKGEEFTTHCRIGVSWAKDEMDLTMQIVSVTPDHWSRRITRKPVASIPH
jgi:hypothetical protein